MVQSRETVTFLFTDIEGSTRLWEQHTQAMHTCLARHDYLLREAIESHHGLVFKTIGDAFCAAFPSAPPALAAALAAQIALAEEPWPQEISLRVRMALNTGVVERRNNDYFGPPLNRVARLLAIGHGGQTLLSPIVHELVKDSLPEGASLWDHGKHSLKDLGQPETVFQLLHPALSADFPPLRSLSNPALPNNLPVQVTSFIGREKEIADVRTLLSNTRLLTLTGSGGGGKTRLGLQVAAELLEGGGDGVWLVELAPIADKNLVVQTIAHALGVREEIGRPLQQTLVEHLKPRNLLLLLDNCEHVLDTCVPLADALLRQCPQVRILATSREAMGIAGEQTYRVPSLSVPTDPKRATVESLGQYEAVRLFTERARAVQPAFTITNAPALAQLCVRLDGIPLAIELSAARLRSLSVEEINQKLDNRFRLLTGGSRTALPRQQTLRALIDWSYDLLNAQEKRLLSRLAVFAAGWSLEAAEHVGAGEAGGSEAGSGEGIEDWEILDLLTSLVDKSLVVAEPQEGHTRYRLLETVREYARDRLREQEEYEALRKRHQVFFTTFAEAAEPQLLGSEQAVWLERVEREHDNLRSAMEWSEAECSLRLAGALWRFWQVRGYFQEGEQWLSAVLARADAETPATVKAKALNGAGVLARSQGNYAQARTWVEESTDLYRKAGDKRGLATTLTNLGLIAFEQGDYAAARTLHAESLALGRELGDKRAIATSLNNLGLVANEQSDDLTARENYAESVGLLRELGEKGGLASVLNNLGNIAHNREEFAVARALYNESLTLRRELGNRQGIAISLVNLGSVAHTQGDYTASQQMYAESLALFEEMGNRVGIAYALGAFADLAYAQEQPTRAARLWGATEALRELLNAPLSPTERVGYQSNVDKAHATLGTAAFDPAWSEGRAFTLAEAIQHALNAPGG
jgi:predicted ATPase/class 3 adenylate cyclase